MAKYFKELSDSLFHTFFGNFNDKVTANGTAWGIDSGKVTELDTVFTGYEPFYLAIVIKKTRTPKQVEDHRQKREDVQDYIEGFANEYIISNSAISDSLIGVMGFNRKANTTAPRPVITEEVFAKIEAQAGSKMLFICRTDTDSSRASVPENADGLELRYTIGTQPATYLDCKEKEISTKARFTLALSPTDAGKKIYGYLRWVNFGDATKNGPWCDMLSTIIRS